MQHVSELTGSIYIILIHLSSLSLQNMPCQPERNKKNNQFNFLQPIRQRSYSKTARKTCLSRNLLQKYNKFLNYKNFGAKNFIFFIFCFSGGPRFEQDRKVMSLTCYQLHQSAIFVIRVRLELTTYRLVCYSRFYTSQLSELLQSGLFHYHET